MPFLRTVGLRAICSRCPHVEQLHVTEAEADALANRLTRLESGWETVLVHKTVLTLCPVCSAKHRATPPSGEKVVLYEVASRTTRGFYLSQADATLEAQRLAITNQWEVVILTHPATPLGQGLYRLENEEYPVQVRD